MYQVDKLPQLTGTACPTTSNSQATNPSTPSAPRSTSSTSVPTQSPNTSSNQKGKRKAVDEAPDYASEPKPLSKHMKASTISVKEIMSCQYGQLPNASQQTVWLCTALSACGVDNLSDDMSVSDLEALYTKIIDDPDADAGNDASEVDVGVYTGATTPMSCGQKLTSTDHTTFDAVYGKTCDGNGKPNLSAVALDNSSHPATQGLSSSPAPTAVHANRRPPTKVPTSCVRDLHRATLECTQWQANAGLAGHASTSMNKVSQGSMGAPLGISVASPSGWPPRPHTTSTPSAPNASLSHGLVISPSIPNASSSGAFSSGSCATPCSHSVVASPSATSLHSPATSTLSMPGVSPSCGPVTPSSRHAQCIFIIPPSYALFHYLPHIIIKLTDSDNPAQSIWSSSSGPGNNITPRHSHGVPMCSAPPVGPEVGPKNNEDDIPDQDKGENEVLVPQVGRTKRARTQLRHFGLDYEPVVKRAVELMLVRMLAQCAFPEVTLAPLPETEEDEDNPTAWSLFDEWIPECWDKANALERRDQLPLAMNNVHRDWIRLQLSQPHNHLFIFLDPDDIRTIFRHPCIGEAIYSVFFKDNGIGAQHLKVFKDMPVPLIAFVCAIIHHVIFEFQDGEWKKEHLNATKDVKWYRRLLSRLTQLARDTPTRLHNIQPALLQICLRDQPDGDKTDESEASIDLGPDLEAEEN
ncbi:hypothetical protein FRC06_009506 [Ceratobasidium sp. 370]|nr:hypothetical protein FRC06_009506 [Ceratobasidium sp. 370]